MTAASVRRYFLYVVYFFCLSPCVMLQFHRTVIKSILTLSIAVWYGDATQQDHRNLNRVVNMASKIIGVGQVSMENL